MKSILLHIGTHKTGSTSIQKFLSRASDQLLEDDVLYPKAGRPEGRTPHGHHVLAWSVQQKQGLEDLEGWEEVVSEIRESPCSRVVLSSEVFATCSMEQVRQVCSLLPNAEIQVLVFLREPFSYIVSMYKQYIRAWGETRSFRQFAEAKMGLCDYSSLLDRWRQGLQNGSVFARSFEKCCKSEGLGATLLDLLDIDPERYVSFLEGPTNVSRKDCQVVAVRWINRLQSRFSFRAFGEVGLFKDRSFAHRVKRQIIRGTRPGQFLARVLSSTLADPLYSDTDKEWFTDRLREERGSPERGSEIVGASF